MVMAISCFQLLGSHAHPLACMLLTKTVRIEDPVPYFRLPLLVAVLIFSPILGHRFYTSLRSDLIPESIFINLISLCTNPQVSPHPSSPNSSSPRNSPLCGLSLPLATPIPHILLTPLMLAPELPDPSSPSWDTQNGNSQPSQVSKERVMWTLRCSAQAPIAN
ncbi:hypothetical protein F5Y04DRAFT_191355 [Hypomontagnella monticulosa]|nr:hypothetical protein F5Y04DRAFT_191355 [Hypomontagnella monticulosa]